MDSEVMAEIKKLSDRVQYLEDQLTKLRRENANLMEELEASRTSGVSSSFVGQVDKKFSEIMQTEEKIQSTVADFSDDTSKKFSQVTQTAEGIKTTVAKLKKNVEDNAEYISEVEQTALSISTTVTKIYGATEAITNKSEMTNKSVMYHYGGFYYYFNEITNDWEKVNTNSVVSQLVQTKDGFVLNGNVKISGDQIVDGVATLRDNVNVGDANTMGSSRGITFNSVAKISTIKGADLFPNEFAGLSISAPLLKLGTLVDFSGATVTGLYAVFE